MGMCVTLYRVPESAFRELAPAEDEDFDRFEWMSKLPELDLGKLWDGVHFVLTDGKEAAAAPLDFLTQGELEVPDCLEAHGHGSERVATIASALLGLSRAELARRFDPSRMEAAGLYPTGIWKYDGMKEELLDLVQELSGFVARASTEREALLIVVDA